MLKTYWPISDYTQFGDVSIPHRYAENQNWTTPKNRTIFSFQSLIGMLKTEIGSPHNLRSGNVSIPHRYAENLVQEVIERPGIEVSIPHRYAENRNGFIYRQKGG